MGINKNLVSIITPSYNSANYIKETIGSVIAQTYQNWEMIIVDDCSTDTSLNVINEYLHKDHRIKLVSLKSNVGAAEARNAALNTAKGRFIAFLDSDDVWLPQKLEIQVAIMLKNNFPITFTEYGVFNEDLSKYKYTIKIPDTINYTGYLKSTIIGMSTAIINREMIGSFSFYNIRSRQDAYLWITLLKRNFIAYGVHENLTKYRLRETSISANKIQAAKKVWFLYYNLEKLGLIKSSYYFLHYAFNALKKRIINQ